MLATDYRLETLLWMVIVGLVLEGVLTVHRQWREKDLTQKEDDHV